MKNAHHENITVVRLHRLSDSQWAWVLFSVWLVYSAVMLWHFKEHAYWLASMCKVAP
jgi:hypothetical protein